MTELITLVEQIGVLAFTLFLMGLILFMLVRGQLKGEAAAYQLARDVREDYEKLSAKLTEVEVERAALRLEFDTLKKEFEKLRTSAEELKKSYEALQVENTALKERVAALEKQLAESQNTINNLLVELKAWKGTEDEKAK